MAVSPKPKTIRVQNSTEQIWHFHGIIVGKNKDGSSRYLKFGSWSDLNKPLDMKDPEGPTRLQPVQTIKVAHWDKVKAHETFGPCVAALLKSGKFQEHPAV